MNIDERALVMTVELLTKDVETLRQTAVQDGENIRGLARIAEFTSGA